ncbi:MAG: hypothetical protein FWH25_04000, partial [Syntrophorhabdaceae bacterium]|nr:hypothetical protein [Syntrophorhabdaceae bacterium]
TASTLVGEKDDMLEAGMSDVLAKPIIRSELNHMLKKWLPGDKLVSSSSKPAVPKAEGEEGDKFWSMIGQIDGLDVPVGLSRVGGQQKVYRKMLELMVQEIEKSNKNLVEFLSANDINSFRIEVHGIKSSLANIGTMGLSGEALALEMASVKEDVDFCTSNLPSFLEKLNILNVKLKEAFEATK